MGGSDARDGTLPQPLDASLGTLGRITQKPDKSHLEEGLEPHAPAKEAEEARLVGEVGTAVVGRYRHTKRLRGATSVPRELQVFPLVVDWQLDDRPEKGQRETRRFAPAEAALLVGEARLVELLIVLAAEGA